MPTTTPNPRPSRRHKSSDKSSAGLAIAICRHPKRRGSRAMYVSPYTLNLRRARLDLTVIVPAYNEAESITDTVRSIQAQTLLPKEIFVVDDFSSDGTGDIARSLGVTVLRPPCNTGSKAGAQNFALTQVKTKYVMAIDADTTLALNGIEELAPALLKNPHIAAACGFVLPRFVGSLWERGRYIEYLFAFTFYKPLQDYFRAPLIASGCFSMYRTHVLKACGGWPTRTMAEDMDLTWSFYERGFGVRFMPRALCFPIEPHTFTFMRKQLTRWSHGFVQNVRTHKEGILHVPFLRSAVAVAFWDATLASLAFIVIIPLLVLFTGNPLFLLGYVIDAPAIAIPVFIAAKRRRELQQAFLSLPAFFILRMVNAYFMVRAGWLELVMGKSLAVYEKGH